MSGSFRHYRHDVRGCIVEPGVEVAYNLSGDVAFGEVVHVTGKMIHIRLLHRAAGHNPGHISKVKRNFAVLRLP